ncbi:MAG: xanthan lyase, partial [Muribaculaceae bacterium]|nr:xanthan lyase [Muribaculaceae bacterium]
TFDFVYTHGEAIRTAGFGFVSSSVEAFAEATDTPAHVDLILGKQKEIKRGRGAYGTNFKAFPAELQARMTGLAGQGTNFFVSGSYVATDLCGNSFSTEAQLEADRKFAAEILGIGWRTGQASVTGEAYEVQTQYKDFGRSRYSFNTELSADCYAVESPDSFYPSDKEKGSTFLRYDENNLAAGSAYDSGSFRTVVTGFPFETIKGDKERAGLMKQILNFFTDPNPLRNTNK